MSYSSVTLVSLMLPQIKAISRKPLYRDPANDALYSALPYTPSQQPSAELLPESVSTFACE